MQEIIKELNNISRMAVIENAPRTQEMTSCISKLLKYTYMEAGEKVLVSRELEMVECYLRYFELKGNPIFEYCYEIRADVKSCFMEPFRLLRIVKTIIEKQIAKDSPISICITVEEVQTDVKLIAKVDGKVIMEEKVV